MKLFIEDVRGTAEAHNLTTVEHRELALLYRAFINADTGYNIKKFRASVLTSLIPYAKKIAYAKVTRANKSLQRKVAIENIKPIVRGYTMDNSNRYYKVNRDCVDFLRLKTLTERQQRMIAEGKNSVFKNMKPREILGGLYIMSAGREVLVRNEYAISYITIEMPTTEAKKCFHTLRTDIFGILSTFCEKIAAEAPSVRKFATPLYKTFITTTMKDLNIKWDDLDLTGNLIEVTREKRGVLTLTLNPLLVYYVTPVKSTTSTIKVKATTGPKELRRAIEEGQS